MIKLTLLSPYAIEFEGEAEEFYVQTPLGPTQVCGGYADSYIALSDDCVLRVHLPSGRRYFAVHHGLLSVKDGRATISCLYCEDGAKLDRNRAEQAKQRADAHLQGKDGDLVQAKAALSRALSRLEASRLSLGGKE